MLENELGRKKIFRHEEDRDSGFLKRVADLIHPFLAGCDLRIVPKLQSTISNPRRQELGQLVRPAAVLMRVAYKDSFSFGRHDAGLECWYFPTAEARTFNDLIAAGAEAGDVVTLEIAPAAEKPEPFPCRDEA